MRKKMFLFHFHLIAVVVLSGWCLAGNTESPDFGIYFHQDLAWSPDGKQIVYSLHKSEAADYDSKNWGVYILDLTTQQETKLIDNAKFVTWAPGGTEIAFSADWDGDWELFTLHLETKKISKLTDNSSDDYQPAWSPNGDQIAFVSKVNGTPGISILSLNSGKVKQMTSGPAHDYHPQWSPDGSFVTFYREKGDGKDQIHLISMESGEESAVTNDERNNVFPGFGPGGRITYAANEPEKSSFLVAVTMDGKDPVSFGPEHAFFARWSPDEERVALIAGQWPHSKILITTRDEMKVPK